MHYKSVMIENNKKRALSGSNCSTTELRTPHDTIKDLSKMIA